MRVLGAFVIVCLAFAGGFLLRGNDAFLAHMGLGAYAVDEQKNPGATISGNTYESVAARVAEVQGILEQESLDSYELEATSSALITDFLKQTGDPYARYYDEQAYLASQRDAEGGFGVGVLFGDYRNQAYAVDVIPGSSAQAAGVQQGDFVVAVNGERRDDGWPMADVLAQVEGEEGATVVVTWRRPETLASTGGDEFTTTLQAGAATRENVSFQLLDNEVGYINLRQLGRGTSGLVSDAVKDLTGQGANALVLDLRDCPGGYLTQAVEVASLFQDGGTVVQINTSDSSEAPTKRTATGAAITSLPLAVVVNDETAAAAEVLVASLQDNGRATVVGQTTMGKGTVQMMQELSFGGAISYTVAEYKTPSGRSIDGVGVVPTITSDADGSGGGEDVQLRLAVEVASAAVRTAE